MAQSAIRTAISGGQNVVALNAPQHRQSLAQRLAAHAALFTTGRRGQGDVFWLKENAEFLNVLECTGQPAETVLEVYEPIYAKIDELMGQFPQYYRFHLSISLDLEDLGMPGTKGEALCAWADREGLAKAELSDLQRAEARRLLARRGFGEVDDALTERLNRFVGRSRTFAIPNRKAAYELTHIVFYLSQYGRRDPGLGGATHKSLTYAGLLAFLDQDMDLLAEICIALRYVGVTPDPTWEEAVITALFMTTARDGGGCVASDDYHAYVVAGWLAGLKRDAFMPLMLTREKTRIEAAPPFARPLGALSRAVSDMQNDDWHAVRGRIVPELDRDARNILHDAERSVDDFESFYALFSRAERPGT